MRSLEYLTEENVAKIKKELLQVLRSHDLNSRLAKTVLTETIDSCQNNYLRLLIIASAVFFKSFLVL